MEIRLTDVFTPAIFMNIQGKMMKMNENWRRGTWAGKLPIRQKTHWSSSPMMKRLCLVLLLFPMVAMAENLPKYFKNKFKSRYFVFHYNDEIRTIPQFATFTDGFIGVINREFFKANFNYPINVYVLKDKAAMQKFLTEKLHVNNPPSFGMYLPRIRGFVTREDSGFGTFTHEIMHPLIGTNLPNAPVWAQEGIPTFFEKFFGYWDGKKLVLEFGFQNPWRIEKLGDKIISLDIEAIVNAKQDYDQCEQRMIAVFLYRHGKFKKFLDLIRTNQKNGYNTFVEAAFEKKMSKLKPLWKQYLAEVCRERPQIRKISTSQVFESREQFETFMKSKGLH